MQTFLPFRNFEASAQCLDDKRLGKQRIECRQILTVLEIKKDKGKFPTLSKLENVIAWENHPAVLMWEGYEKTLEQYYRAIVMEWLKRGHANTLPIPKRDDNVARPPWLGLARFHRSHRSNLLRKNKDHYGEFFDDCPDDLPYFWPVRKERKSKKSKGKRNGKR